ncbi:alpha-L-fucosidase [Pseudoxanthomonas sacheonensis]|uniref:alpha-L-fucosidase n=1 Tax=Pseudoxanthomonas sacheonensis TaxID=443615 RepID=UPI0013D021F2|nr:alpha-L-fucosidase [Pseudoxanthomonas sacheonensis]KAF1708177.1 alpha-L-fucosidase [Pseudoxanthomonas sacheonensis]
MQRFASIARFRIALRYLTACACLLAAPLSMATSTAPTVVASTESKAAFDARMQWWREARFGLFVHWGLYSGAAGRWNGRPVAGTAEWIQRNAHVPADEYARQMRPLFRPKPGFAREWARLARQAGAKYLVFTSKHHEGFALHDSAVTTFDAKDFTDRDLVKEIVDAARAEGLKVGLYHSVIDWHHPAYPYRDFLKLEQPLPHPLEKTTPAEDPGYPQRADLKEYQDYLQAQVRELVEHYGPIDILWWDYSNPGAEGETWRARELMAMVRERQPGIVMNNRLYRSLGYDDPQGSLKWFDRAHGDFTTPEQAIPANGVVGVDWEACMTMNDTWGYNAHDRHWKSTATLIRDLVDAASKGGNFLLNIGPQADGSVPQASVLRLRQIGAWMQRNGESVYATTASPLDAVGWGRVTARGERLYLHVFERTKDGMLRLPLSGKRSAKLLQGGASLETSREGETLVVALPAELPDAIDTVVVLDPA